MRLLIAAVIAIAAHAQQIDGPFSDYVEVIRAADGTFYTFETTKDAGLITTRGAIQSRHGGGLCIFGIRPPQSGPCTDIYIRKMAANGQNIIAATYFGGDGEEGLPRVLVSPDGSLLLSFSSRSSNIAGGLNSSFSNSGVLMRLSPNLDRVEAIRRLPQNSSLRVVEQSPTELYVAGTELRTFDRYTIFVEAIDPKTLQLRRSFSYETSFGVRTYDLLWRPSGDLLLAWGAQLDGSRVVAIDPHTGEWKWNTQIAPSNEIKAIGLLPGDGVVAFANGFTDTGATQSFLQRLGADGRLLEEPLQVGTYINFARTNTEGILEWTGVSTRRGILLTSPNAPFRCRPSLQSQYYARMHYSQGQPDFVSYLSPEAQLDPIGGAMDSFPLTRNRGRLYPTILPTPLDEAAPACLEAEVENYAFASGRSRTPNFDPTGGRTATPGEFLTLYGSGISDGQALFHPEVTGSLPTEVAGTRVLVDGRPVGIIELSPSRITIAVPYEVSVRETAFIVMERNGVPSAPVDLKIVPTKLHVYSEPIERVGLAGAYKNGVLVKEQNPVEPGDEVAVYINGAGVLSESVEADKIVSTDSLPRPLAEVRAFVDGSGYQVVNYAGAVRGQLPGLIQVNVRIAPDLKYVGRLTLRIMIGSDSATTDFWLRQP